MPIESGRRNIGGLPVSESQARYAVERTLTVPDNYRQFTLSSAEAERTLTFDMATLQLLLDLGLPHRGADTDVRFDPIDLENISTTLRLPSPYWKAMRLMTKSLRASGPPPGAWCEVHVSWTCPEPGHGGQCSYSFDPEFAQVIGIGSPPEGCSITVRAALANEEHEFDESFREVILQAEALSFHRLPSELRADLGYLRETRMADCRSASQYLTWVARQAGFSALPASGFFVGQLVSARHAWFEIEVGGRWVPADPFFLSTLHEWGMVDKDSWPTTRSPRNVLWRIGRRHGLSFRLLNHGSQRACTKLTSLWRTEP